jgi:molybdopterin-guanine dinucleotide biosynthesis protein
MAEWKVSAEPEPTALYEVRLQGTDPEPLRRAFPTARVYTTPTETVLVRRVEEPAELDELIDQLLSRGVVLTEVHEVSQPRTSASRQPGSHTDRGLRDDDDI